MTSVTPPGTESDEWYAALDGAFQLLLGGKSYEDPAAVYGVYYADDSVDEFLFPNTWATPEALTGREPGEMPFPGAGDYPFSPAKWRFDFGESLFRFDGDLLDTTGPWDEGGHKGPRPVNDDFIADVRAAAIDGLSQVLVRGADLGPLLARHGIDLSDESFEQLNGWVTLLLRADTDGTLAHAMRTATYTDRGPDDLAPFGESGYVEAAEPRWEETLSAVTHPALRDHLRMLCLDEDDARADGALYCEAEEWPFDTFILEELGHSLIAGWQYGESQAGTAVVLLPGSTDSR